jgi:NADPH:quinone reductase-like Zn-dependent oxidoreductase
VIVKAVRLYAFGDPSVLVYEEAPRPNPGRGEVLVRVHAAGVNPADWKIRQRGPWTDWGGFPLILGWDISGVIEAIGPEVSSFQVGDAVYGMVRFPQQGAAYAEYVAAPADQLALKPTTIDHMRAAAVPLAALTAWQALFDTANLMAGQTVLVHAAAGGVGHFAVQLAKWKGATVLGTASARNGELLRELGVDRVIDYTAAPFETSAQELDVVLNTVDGEILSRSWSTLKPGGFLVSIAGQPSPEQAAAHRVQAKNILVHTSAAQLVELASLIDAGHINPMIETVLPLSDAAKAHSIGERGRTRGKIVLRIAE